MRTKTKVQAGALIHNHNQVSVKRKVKVGSLAHNHNQPIR